MIQSLRHRRHSLASSKKQLSFLEENPFRKTNLPSFQEKIKLEGSPSLRPSSLEILQVNIGYLCNQTCQHCHVDAGPDRRELMDIDTIFLCLDICKKNKIQTLDITGGAPEMHPHFIQFIQEAKAASIPEIIVRSNLTVLVSHPKYASFPDFLYEHGVRIISSLPCYTAEGTDKQRGQGVFQKSIRALQKLNAAGYAVSKDSPLLDLVYNPNGPFLPPNQKELELSYKERLKKDFDITFHNLFTLTNLPISRFLEFLLESQKYEEYMETLVNSFNPAALSSLMCRNTLSIDYRGYMYDCDFNQMLGISVNSPAPRHIKDFDLSRLQEREISVNQHCYGCTAGFGSSCQGALT